MDQARRVPRSLEEQIEIRKAREVEKEVYVKPDMEQLLELVGGDARMTNLPGPQGVKLRELLAHRALHVKEKIHSRAVNKKIASPKKTTFIQKHIAPIWREDALHSSDDDTDDEEEKALKANEKKERALERKRIAEEILVKRKEEAERSKFSVKTEKRTDVKIEDAMGKPRKKVELTKYASEVD